MIHAEVEHAFAALGDRLLDARRAHHRGHSRGNVDRRFPALAAVPRELNQSVVGTDPDEVLILRRRRDAVDDSPVFPLLRIGVGEYPQVLRRSRIGTRQILRDLVPALAPIRGLKHHVRSQQEQPRILFRKNQRHSAIGAEFSQ